MITPGNRVADVGCDHGFVSIYLVQQGISPYCLAMDVRKGPLSAATEHVREQGMEAYIETRLSDGLKACEKGETDAMLCCGMGGPLMAQILTDSAEKAHVMKELVLQPQSEIPWFRRFLRENGYRITDENMVWEEGKYYFMMRVVPGEESLDTDSEMQELWDAFGRRNLEQRHPVLLQYLHYRLDGLEKTREQLSCSESAKAQVRRAELLQEEQLLQKALQIFTKE